MVQFIRNHNDFLARMMIASFALGLFLVGLSDSNSVIVASNANGGFFYSIVLGCLAINYWFDIVVNDWMPARFVFPTLVRMRTWLYLGGSTIYLMHLFIGGKVRDGLDPASLIIYVIVVFFGVLVSVRNLFFLRGQVCKY